MRVKVLKKFIVALCAVSTMASTTAISVTANSGSDKENITSSIESRKVMLSREECAKKRKEYGERISKKILEKLKKHKGKKSISTQSISTEDTSSSIETTRKKRAEKRKEYGEKISKKILEKLKKHKDKKSISTPSISTEDKNSSVNTPKNENREIYVKKIVKKEGKSIKINSKSEKPIVSDNMFIDINTWKIMKNSDSQKIYKKKTIYLPNTHKSVRNDLFINMNTGETTEIKPKCESQQIYKRKKLTIPNRKELTISNIKNKTKKTSENKYKIIKLFSIIRKIQNTNKHLESMRNFKINNKVFEIAQKYKPSLPVITEYLNDFD